MNSIRSKLFVFLTVAAFLSSCTVTTYKLTPEEFAGHSWRTKLQVQTTDGKILELTNVSLRGSKLVGTTGDKKPVELETTEVRSVWYTKTDAGRAFLWGGAAIVAGLLAIGAATAPSPPPAECCPFVYSFDGQKYVFEAEPYGGAICRALKRSEWCRLDHLRESGGGYRIALSNELEETEHTDEVKLLVVDHKPGLGIAPDASGGIHTFARPLAPLRAVDANGADIRTLVARTDGVFWEPAFGKFPGARQESLRDEVVLEFPKPAGATKVKLLANAWTTLWGSQVAQRFLELFGNKADAWIADVNSLGPEYRWVQGWYAREGLYLLPVEVETRTGWKPRGLIYGAGPFAANVKCYPLDISDAAAGDTLRIRIAPPKGFWRFDSLTVDYSEDALVRTSTETAVIGRDLEGRDVSVALAASDDRCVVMPRRGEMAEIVFPKPPQARGSERSFVVKVTGYYDIHLAAQGEPDEALLRRFHTEPGFTLEFARDAAERLAATRAAVPHKR